MGLEHWIIKKLNARKLAKAAPEIRDAAVESLEKELSNS